MAKSKNKSNLSPEMRTALITAAVAVATALLASPVIVELIRREPTPPPISAVALSIYNEHCLDQDFYVDDLLVATVKSGVQMDIQVNSGEHHHYACESGTVNCGSIYYSIWTQNAVLSIPSSPACIPPAPAPITITVTNENCQNYDLYLDDYYYSTIYEGETQSFSVEPGAHIAKGCILGTEICSASTQQEWIQDAAWTISREATCP
ncbi:MAG: hypothetical protein L0Z71_11835 [Anaerolineae bacterium]|nr:hypothetical protein [Anaerolineae bacterium]